MKDHLYNSDDPYSSYQNTEVNRMRMRKQDRDSLSTPDLQFLEEKEEEHDCHASPEDGCAGCELLTK